jgi:hypothetical protein
MPRVVGYIVFFFVVIEVTHTQQSSPAASITSADSSCTSAAKTPQVKSVVTLDNKIDADGKFSGTSDAKMGEVRVCVNDVPQTKISVDKDGRFDSGTASAVHVSIGDKVTAQAVSDHTYGPLSNQVTVGACSSTGTGSLGGDKPVLDPVMAGDKRVSGTLSNAPAGSVRICVDDREVAEAQLAPDGTFVTSLSTALGQGQSVLAQQIISAPGHLPQTYGLPGPAKTSAGMLSIQDKGAAGTTTVMIGGWEQAGYSSLGLSGNPFVQIFIKGPSSHWITGWGRVRLLSAPQPSTQGIVSTFTDPTGQLTTQDYTKVGQALDFTAGPDIRFSKYWSFVIGAGATTPFSSQNVTLVYQAPAPGTVECTTMTSRFTIANGYFPGITQAPPGSKTCLNGGYSDIAFSNQDRSSFLRKYGAGFRSVYPFPCKSDSISAATGGSSACATAYGTLDLGIAQDESITGGKLRGWVFKTDGVLPIPTGNVSWLYLFGSVYIRFSRNVNNSPLILQTATGVTIPAPSVIVLPLLQPNRDYYRLGVGLNINQIFCKLSGSTCPSKSSTTTNPAPTLEAASPLSPPSAKAGGKNFPLTVNGTNFVSGSSGSTVQWNGKPLTTTFVSETELTAVVPSSNIKTAGTATVTVKTPTPGGGTSGSTTFTINP